MDEKGAPAELKEDPSAQTANNTPSKARQNGHTAVKKQARAAKQLRFDAQTGAPKSTAGAQNSSQVSTTDAAAQADLTPGPHTASDHLSHPTPQAQTSPSRSLTHPTVEVHAVHTRDIAVGSGSDGSQPKRRKRTSVAKNAHARAHGSYGNHAAHAPHAGYGHHPIHGHYMHGGDYETGHSHGTKAKKQAVHRAPKQDDKGPCLNPACRTTDTPQWRLGPMFCRELCNRCGTRWQRAKNTRNPQGFFVWVRNDLRSQGLEVPDAVARPAASPELALAALREVENQPHAGRQHKAEEPEISDDDEDVEQEGEIGGRYAEEIMEGEEEESDMSAPEIVTHHRGGHRRPQPRRLAAPFDLLPHHKGHRTAHRATAEHFSEAALRMGHTQHEDEEDSGASEADLLCSEVLSESLDDGSDVGSDEMYARRYYRIPQGYYDEEGDSEMSESQADEEVAVTKRGRAVKLPAKYKAEVEKMQHRKRKGEDSPEGRRHKRHAMEYGYHAVNYDSPQRMQRGGAGQLPPRAVGGSPAGRPAGKSSSKSHGSPLGRTDKVARGHMIDRRAREASFAAPTSRGHMGYGRPHNASYPRQRGAYELDEADTDAVDALMGMTGVLYAH